jgi:uncharacterized protein (TIGR02391 family)
MANSALIIFERFARNAARLSEPTSRGESQHPFELRDIHTVLPKEVRRLFDNAHYAQATFEACKYLDSEVRRLAHISKSGETLMMAALSETTPLLRLTNLSSESERDEQRGYRFLFAGTIVGIRNPRGHQHSVIDDVGTCLDQLSLVSQLLRRLEKAGFQLS